MDREDRNGAMWASHPTIPPSMPAALPPPFTQGRLIGIKILAPPCKGSWIRACEQTEGFANKQDSPILFSQSQHNISPTPQQKKKQEIALLLFLI